MSVFNFRNKEDQEEHERQTEQIQVNHQSKLKERIEIILPPVVQEQWLFVSHSHKDLDTVRFVRNILEEYRFNPLLFYLKCIDDDDELDSLIKREIDSRPYFLLCNSKNARNSRWVKEEVEYITKTGRLFRTVDISGSEADIRRNIAELKRDITITVFFDDSELYHAVLILERLGKYDFSLQAFPLTPVDNSVFQDWSLVRKTLSEAMDDGFVLLILGNWLLSDDPYVLDIKDTFLELLKSDYYDPKRFISLIPTKRVREEVIPKTEFRPYLNKMTMETSFGDTMDGIDRVVNRILTALLTPSLLLMYAMQFSNKKSTVSEQKESKKLKQLFFSLTMDSNNPADMIAKAHCLETGFGIEQNLEEAHYLYKSVQKHCAYNTFTEDINRVKEKINAEDETPLSFRKRVRRFFLRLYWRIKCLFC